MLHVSPINLASNTTKSLWTCKIDKFIDTLSTTSLSERNFLKSHALVVSLFLIVTVDFITCTLYTILCRRQSYQNYEQPIIHLPNLPSIYPQYKFLLDLQFNRTAKTLCKSRNTKHIMCGYVVMCHYLSK